MTISLVAAVAQNGVIGRAGGLPWHLPADLQRFREITMGHIVIMGRRTYDSIGRVLPGRRFVVVSADKEFRPDEVTVVESFLRALAVCAGEEEVMVIGGARIFAEALPLAHRMYWTAVHATPVGDVHFPEVDWSAWRLLEEEHRAPDDRNPYSLDFRIYERVPPA